MAQHSISIIVPALNEEGNIGSTLSFLVDLLPQHFSDWEILVFNDGSTDQTGVIADLWGRKEARIRTFHHATPQNLGGCYRQGVRFAQKQFVMLVPGDGECGDEMLAQIFLHVGVADILIPYPTNQTVRPRFRQILSSAFVFALNRAAQLNIRYYNGAVVHRMEIARRFLPRTMGFDYQAETLVRALRAKCTYKEIPVLLSPRLDGKSKALRPKNWLSVGRFLARVALGA